MGLALEYWTSSMQSQLDNNADFHPQPTLFTVLFKEVIFNEISNKTDMAFFLKNGHFRSDF